MSKRSDTALYFTSVVAMERDFAFFAGHLSVEGLEPSMTRCMYIKEGSWGHLMDVDEPAYGASKRPPQAKKKGAYCVMGRTGHYYEYRVGSGADPVDISIDLGANGYLMDLRWIGSHLHACGVQNQVFRQEGTKWSRMDRGTFVPLDEEVDRIFNAIDGFSENDIYAAGYGGDVWHWDGSRWAQLESPTNYNLHSVFCASDGLVYLGGGKGRLFAGTKAEGWRELSDAGVTTGRLEAITEFKGRIYIATKSALLSMEAGELRVVDVPIKGKKSFYRIDAVAEAMWTVGDDCILQFDGKKWTRYTCPENE